VALFQHKQSKPQTPAEMALDEVHGLFDDTFREELRNHGREYFDRVIAENATLFKQDLDATIEHVNTELKQHMARQLDQQLIEINQATADLRQHVTQQLDDQLAEYSKSLKEAQDLALQALDRSAKALEEQHKQLAASLQQSVASQDAMLVKAFDDNKTQMAEIEKSQAQALEWLERSEKALREQYEKLGDELQQSVTEQKNMLVGSFESNMAAVVEHYLLQALGDQFDMKAQLPSIIKELEANKQAIVDDMTV